MVHTCCLYVAPCTRTLAAHSLSDSWGAPELLQRKISLSTWIKQPNPTILEHDLLLICMAPFQRAVCPIPIGGGRKSPYAINNDSGRCPTNFINHGKQTYRCMSHVRVSSGLLATVNSDRNYYVVEVALKAVIELHPDGDTLDKELLTPS